jgi:hypothetical protein
MSEEEDLVLLALQRQLDDAFHTTRPRPAFEDELWLRMQSRRPLWQRFRDGLSGMAAGLREAPAVPAAAVAIVLIVLVGAGIVTLGGLHLGGGASLATGTVPTSGGDKSLQPATLPAFGILPAPGAAATSPALSNSATYVGPVALTWTGHLDVTASNLPVFRYQEPTRSTADQFAVSVGAAPSAQVAPGGIGMYTGENFTLVVIGTVQHPLKEPSFSLSDLKSLPAGTASDPVAVATAYLAAHSLIPSWPYQTVVQKTGTTVRASFLRSFDLQAQGQAPLVDSAGERYGIDVNTATGTPGAYETGPLPLTLESVAYPIISADQAVRSALASSAPTGGSATVPVVRLTTAELVYAVAWAGDHSFYEPAFLFSGTFTDHSNSYVKRVLIPAVTPALVSH